MKSLKILLIVTCISLAVALFWNSVPLVKDTVHFVLNPTAGYLLDWNVSWGLVIITALVSLFITIVQKYTVDNDSLRELKKEQKLLQEEMKKFKEHPEKLMALQKKQLEFIPKTMDLTMRPLVYTAIPIILFFRWFNDYFITLTPELAKIFGLISWFWAYLILSIIFSMILRKLFKLP